MTFDPSEKLSAESRALLDAVGDGDAPTAADQVRVRAGIARRLAIGVAAAAVVATTTKTAAAGSAAGASATSAGAGVAASSAIAGTTAATSGVVAGGSAVGGGAAVLGLASTGTKILAVIALVSAAGAGALSYRPSPTTDSPSAIASSRAADVTDRGAASRSPSPRARSVADAPAAIDSSAAVVPSVITSSVAAASATNASAPSMNGRSGNGSSRGAGTAANAIAPRSPSADTSGDLVAELALLRDAHAALQDGDGARALALLSDHARRFPAGALTEEREASRVLALCNVGRVLEARDAASRFLREHPRSPQADRVGRACDAATTF